MKQISSMKRKEGIAGVLFIAPTIVYFLVFFALPLFVCVYASFTNWNILSPNRSFVGWRNYSKLLSDPKFWTALSNTFYMLIPIPLYLFFLGCCLPMPAIRKYHGNDSFELSIICPTFHPLWHWLSYGNGCSIQNLGW